ncbi:2TM domain-containing protein [Robiginitalea myxolifaciens]|uniref:2TM domain-containing protein n=1 Tax=Robiginitalea myxolifaciens TaxID=400055 RepID=A0A1I6FMU6_9FLAO|nr:2TM domain-containing protein [Robiginitalea myxolifaciens]SFR31273.1 2TM domain-containing protein [Robiginitalea myxolifaciens]
MKELEPSQLEAEFDKRARAKKRVEEIKGFYVHLTIYLVINLLIIGWSIYQNVSQGEPIFRWPMLLTPFFWGIGLGFHFINTFNVNPFFGKDWERRKLQEFMDQDEEEARKFK